MINPRTFFDFSIHKGEPRRVIFELFKDVVPKTAENFRALCTGERGMSIKAPDRPLWYKGSAIHRIVPGFMIQGGDFIHNNGKSGESIYGDEFEDENFDLKCDQEGLLVMANKGPHTNQSQFFITLRPAEHLNDKHVVFGRVQSGFDVIESIAQVETDPKKHRPIGGEEAVKIVHCGELELRKKVKPVKESAHLKRRSSEHAGSRSPSPSSSSSKSSRSSVSSESSGAARKRRRRDRKEAKAAKKTKKSKRLKLKDTHHRSPSVLGPTEEELELQRIEDEHRAAEEARRAVEAARRLEEERQRKHRALELLKQNQSSNSRKEGGVVFKGRGAMRYRDKDVGLGTRAWKE
ncbi:hypothetical protein CROQUDRAFT_661274 [Cronartium quercuum f. sp. fusiforme G11]|uniref:peptidylprolyl isomerase n=1 Tax=Cronartium quercuum f. sp. fusiforme G11 TaxID=708437 RepID=A0A9P6NC39_9BASI|nr:hypothetical protein CROQUDRAFT_661274 [Cronartium quercuum f. sp. fusiforme G11]